MALSGTLAPNFGGGGGGGGGGGVAAVVVAAVVAVAEVVMVGVGWWDLGCAARVRRAGREVVG